MAVKNKFLKQMAEKADQAEKNRELSLDDIKKFGYMRVVSVEDILEDPDNRMIYGDDYQTDALADSIRQYGFKGGVLVYPYGKDGKYMLQSGHRSLEAARKAGMETIPAVVTEKPASDLQRRQLLITRNLNMRTKTPMMTAREIQYLYDAYKEQREKDSDGSRPSGMIRERLAQDFHISTAQVERYRRLLKLIEPLQKMVENEQAPWSALSEAAAMDPAQQEQLAKFLADKLRLRPGESLTKSEIMQEIKICRMIKPVKDAYEYDPNDTSMLSDDLKKKLMPEEKTKRRINQKTAAEKSAFYLSSMLDSSSFVYKKDKKEVIDILEKMKSDIDAALLMLKN